MVIWGSGRNACYAAMDWRIGNRKDIVWIRIAWCWRQTGGGKGGNGVSCCTYVFIINHGIENLCGACHAVTLHYLNLTEAYLLAPLWPLQNTKFHVTVRYFHPHLLVSAQRRTITSPMPAYLPFPKQHHVTHPSSP